LLQTFLWRVLERVFETALEFPLDWSLDQSQIWPVDDELAAESAEVVRSALVAGA